MTWKQTFNNALEYAQNRDGLIMKTQTGVYATDGTHSFVWCADGDAKKAAIFRLIIKSEMLPTTWHRTKAARLDKQVDRLKRLAKNAIDAGQFELAQKAIKKAARYSENVEEISARERIYYRLPQGGVK